MSRLPPAARDFGIVFQSYALFPNLTVADNVGYGLVNRRTRRRQRSPARVHELLALVGLPEQGSKYPVQLSGGQQQRVALARALATSPGLLLLDEPLSALDARVRVRLRDEIKSLQRRLGVTTIMVTHDQEEALAMADRIVVMNQGVIEQVGTPAEIYRAPAQRLRRRFRRRDDISRRRSRRAPSACGSARWRSPARTIAASRAAPRVQLGLRPEEMRVRNIEPATPNKLDHRRSRCWISSGRSAARGSSWRPRPASTLLADFSANLMRDLGIGEGQTLTVALPPESLRVFATG